MSALLNMLAALLLTVLPALKPCDCRGFTLVCACAIPVGESSNAEVVKVSPTKCCCCHAEAGAGEQSDEDSPQPLLPRKHGGCMKFAFAEVGQALGGVPLAASADPVVYLLPLAEQKREAPRETGRFDFFERPPPIALRVVHLHFIRI